MFEFAFAGFLVIIGIILAGTSIKIANENERFAVFVLGRFEGYKGPGLVLVVPFVWKLHKLSVGDTGTLTSSEFAKIGGFEYPVANINSLQPGQTIRIDHFDAGEPRLVASVAPSTAHCPKCGHEF